MKYDEIISQRAWSRSDLNVLLSLGADKLDLANPRVRRTDKDFAVAWSKYTARGFVFQPGHPIEAWQDPDIRKMYFKRSSGR